MFEMDRMLLLLLINFSMAAIQQPTGVAAWTIHQNQHRQPGRQAAPQPAPQATYSLDCSLNGVKAADGSCRCDPQWEGGQCERLAFVPGTHEADVNSPWAEKDLEVGRRTCTHACTSIHTLISRP